MRASHILLMAACAAPIAAAALALAGLSNAAAAPDEAAPGYNVTQTVSLGAPDRWDYVIYDPSSDRVFVSHGDRLTVVDGTSGKIVGQVAGMPGGTHGVAIVPAQHRGYTDDGDAGIVRAFDLKTLKAGATMKAQDDADGMGFDPASGHIFVVNSDPGTLTIIDPAKNSVVAKINVGAKLEYAVADGKGHIFANGNAKHEIVAIDSRSNTVTAHWPMPACVSPRGLAIDPAHERVFSGCANGVMTIMDVTNGAVLANLPIGQGSDGVVFDAKRQLAISANGGTGDLTLVRQVDAKTYKVVGTIKTTASARTLGLNPKTGRLFLAAAEPDPVAPASARKVVPGSLKLMFLDPK